MYRSNLWIIDDILSELKELKKNKKYFKKPTNFTRDCVFKFEMIFCLIIDMPRKSLSVEIDKALTKFNKLLNENKEGAKSGFCKARKKIKPELFIHIHETLVDLFYCAKNSVQLKKWKGFYLLAIDGSVVDLIDTEEVREKFGAQIHQYGSQVQGRMMVAYDVVNRIIKKCTLESYFTGEITIVKEWISSMGQDSLCIYDRLFPSLELMCIHNNNKVPYLMRSKLTFNNHVKKFEASGKKDVVQDWEITDKVRLKMKKRGINIKCGATLKVRLIKIILDSGEVEILITSLTDKQKYPHKIFKKLYFKRWGVEVKIGFLKNILQMELTSGRSVETIIQDFYGTIIRANIQSLIESDCEKEIKQINKKRKLNYQVNSSVAAGFLKNKIADLFYSPNREIVYQKMIRLFTKNLEPIRDHRELPRKKSSTGTGKYRPLKNYKKIA